MNSEDEQPNVTRTGFAARLRAPLACGAVQGGSLPVHTSVRARTGRGARRAARRGSRARCVHEGGTEGGVWLPRAPQVLNLAPSLAVARPHHVLSRGTICQGAAQRVLPRPREAHHFLAVVRTARTARRVTCLPRAVRVPSPVRAEGQDVLAADDDCISAGEVRARGARGLGSRQNSLPVDRSSCAVVRRRFWRPKRHKSADPPRAGMPRVVAHRLCAWRCERGPAPRQEGNLKLSCGRRPQGRPAGLAAASGPARVLLGAPMGPLPCVKAACVASGRTSRGGWHLR